MSIRAFMTEHYRHFNAAVVVDAARAWQAHHEAGNTMMLALAGAMSTAELGRSLAELIRRGFVHAITCTGANLEEDLFNLVAHHSYERVPHWRDLTPQDELELLERGMNRVTDTCIPEEDAFRKVERILIPRWKAAGEDGRRELPARYLCELLLEGAYEPYYEADPNHSWLLAAAHAGIPIYTPGWEDSTLGNVCAARALQGKIPGTAMIKSGLEQMQHLVGWYTNTAANSPDAATVGLFQIGGGIAGDFPICAVPLIRQDLRRDVPLWSYFCQISDSTTSYGSYSGAVPNEKITWEKLAPDTPRFMIESDATIVAPLVFAWLLDW